MNLERLQHIVLLTRHDQASALALTRLAGHCGRPLGWRLVQILVVGVDAVLSEQGGRP